MRRIGKLSVSFALFFCIGCGGGSPAEPDEESPPPPPPPVPGPGPHFSVLPIPIDKLARITPLGHNNKTMPNDGTYWTICDDQAYLMQSPYPCTREHLPIRAPRDAVVHAVEAGPDGGITLQGPPGLYIGFGHVNPIPGIAKGDSVKAGDPVAIMHYDYSFDVNTYTLAGPQHTFANMARIPPIYRHAQNAIEQFPEPLRSQLISRVQTVEDPIGRLSFDVVGTASGIWFVEGTQVDSSFVVSRLPSQLYLGPLAERHSTRMMAVGLRWANQLNTHMYMDPSAPAWESITVASGMVASKAWGLNRDGTSNTDFPHGTVLVQMLTSDRIRVEWFNTHDPVTAFTAAARIYER